MAEYQDVLALITGIENGIKKGRMRCAVCVTFDLVHGGQLALPGVVEGVRGDRFEVGRVVAGGRRGAVAAFAHARMVAQAALLQVGVGQGVHHRNALRRVEHQHLRTRHTRCQARQRLLSLSFVIVILAYPARRLILY